MCIRDRVTPLGEGVYELTTVEGNVNSCVRRYRYRYDATPKERYKNTVSYTHLTRTRAEICCQRIHDLMGVRAMEWPFVSVILPVRNEEKFIVDCTKSIFEQDYPRSQMELSLIHI